MIYVAFFKDPAKPAEIQARKITRGFSCRPEELRREIAIACGLARKCRDRPERLLVDYHIYSSEEAADELLKWFKTDASAYQSQTAQV